jgi:hypothetical protein
MSKNKLYTLSYFRKRLKDANISSIVLLDKYDECDYRYWSISIDNIRNILCTCMKHEDEYYFVFSDCRQHILNNKIIKTESMNVIIEFLKTVI